MDRDFAAEIRGIVDDNFLQGTPLADALAVVADGIDALGAHVTAQLNSLTERVEACEAEQVLG